jgi:hypothetical protein
MAGKQQRFSEKYQPKKNQIAGLLLLFLPLYRLIFTETYRKNNICIFQRCSDNLSKGAPFKLKTIQGTYGVIQNYAVGGFNVSNLMGIKRRMIDIGKK